ncbi:hypothetical protein [Streptococcus dentiloxodontae]
MIRVEYWEDISDKWYLVANDHNGLIVKEETDLKDPALILKFKSEAIPLTKARTRLFQHYVSSRVRVSSFDMKEYFLRKIDLENHKKVNRLASEHPKAIFRQIKAEFDYFGKAFLKGFLEVYHIKLTNEVDKYERALHIVGESNLGGDEDFFSIVKPTRGDVEVVVSGFVDFEHARENLDRFLGGY